MIKYQFCVRDGDWIDLDMENIVNSPLLEFLDSPLPVTLRKERGDGQWCAWRKIDVPDDPKVWFKSPYHSEWREIPDEEFDPCNATDAAVKDALLNLPLGTVITTLGGGMYTRTKGRPIGIV